MMTLKEKELVAVGISVVAGCKPCTDYHLRAVRKAKATNEEVRRVIADAIRVRASAQQVMENYGLGQLDTTRCVDECSAGKTRRLYELVSVGAAYAVNCTTNLEKHLAVAAALGITGDEVRAVIRLARLIKARAATHVEKLVKMSNETQQVQLQRQAAAGVRLMCRSNADAH